MRCTVGQAHVHARMRKGSFSPSIRCAETFHFYAILNANATITSCVRRVLCNSMKISNNCNCRNMPRFFFWFCKLRRLLQINEASSQIIIMSEKELEFISLKFAKLSDKAFAPIKGSEYAAGYDLRSAYKYVIPAHGKELVKTDLQIEVPLGTYGRVAPRSGLAWKNHIDVGAGVIDADYRGNLGVVLFNHSNEDFEVAPGDRIAQLICERIMYPRLEEVESLNDTNRGTGGFGSTGMK